MIKNWSNIIKELNMMGISKCILDNCSLISLDEEYGAIVLEILKKYENLLTDFQLKKIRKAISSFLGKEFDLTIKITDGDVTYRALQDFTSSPLDVNM